MVVAIIAAILALPTILGLLLLPAGIASLLHPDDTAEAMETTPEPAPPVYQRPEEPTPAPKPTPATPRDPRDLGDETDLFPDDLFGG